MKARTAGFTLVEVLVALVVMAMMAMMAWRGIDALVTSRGIAQGHLDQSARLQTVIEQWETDLRALQDPVVVDPLNFDGSTLRLTRRQAQGMQVVAWSVRNGYLYRWEGPIVQSVAALEDSYQRSEQLVLQDSGQVRALEGVAGWQLYYYRGNAWSNAQSSAGSATSTTATVTAAAATPAASGASGAAGANASNVVVTTTTILPTGIRMLLQFDPGSGFAGPLTREIVLGPQP